MIDKLIDKNVLLVDDEASNIYALSSYLESRQMNVSVARNGQEAMDMLHSGNQPDLILLDMMMPVMDGYETLANLKLENLLEKIPVIAVTARAMKGDKEKCLDAGAWDYISKPVDLQALLAKMSTYVR
ncbi:MAG: response regulator [Chitinophagales bacterium]